MRASDICGVFFLSCLAIALPACSRSEESEAAQRERLYQRFLNEAGRTDDPIARRLFDQLVLHPSFGLGWDEVPAPTLRGTAALASVQAFVATNGWNMQTGRLLFTYGLEKVQPIRGLPWKAIKDREFSALTHGGILYIMLSGFHHDCSGVAFNPSTNRFPSSISGFKPIGDHWYVWKQTEIPIEGQQKYEGQP